MIKILLVDDQNIFCEVLQSWLESVEDFQVLDRANNGQVAVEKVAYLKPDIVLIDIEMPEMDGVTATKIIAKNYPDTKVIILSSHDEDSYLAKALQAGAKGYLIKNTTAEDLVTTIRSISRGYSQMSPGILERIISKVNPAMTVENQPEIELETISKEFDPAILDYTIDQVKRQDLGIFLARLQDFLKIEPYNLAILYLLGVLIKQQENDISLALEYLARGFQEGIKQGLVKENLLLFYREGVKLDRRQAFGWLTQVNSPFNSLDGLDFLLTEAEALFGNNSDQYQSLLLLWQIRMMSSWGEIYAKLCNGVKSLVISD
jgi:DNA-binding NarL/FixJ family response regulator